MGLGDLDRLELPEGVLTRAIDALESLRVTADAAGLADCAPPSMN